MTNYKMIAETHEGVISVEHECWGVVEAENAIEAMKSFATTEANVTWCEEWGCCLCGARKIRAVANV